MNNFDIEASLRKVNQKFIEDLTAEEKKNVLKKFKKAYACTLMSTQNKSPN